MFTSQKFWVFGVNEVGEVATIIQDHVEWLSIGEVDGLLYAPDVFLVCLSLPGIHWHPRLGHAAAAWSWVENMLQLDHVTCPF